LDQAQASGGILGMYNTFAGGAFDRCAIDALSIMPYISAPIILQLLTAVWPRLSKLARKDGGRTKIVQYGRYLTVILCVGQALLVNAGQWWNQQYDGQYLVMRDHYSYAWFVIQTVMVLTTGTMLLMWLREQITERGIGNGVSLIITANILSRMPAAIHSANNMFFGDNPT